MKQQPEERQPFPHLLTLSERRVLSLTGVRDVESFDDLTVVLLTEQGELTVRGTGLQITRLSLETGDMALEGVVDSLVYSEMKVRSGGFFGKLFR